MQNLPSHIVAHMFQYVQNETMQSTALLHTCKLFYTTLLNCQEQVWNSYPVILDSACMPNAVLPKVLCKFAKILKISGRGKSKNLGEIDEKCFQKNGAFTVAVQHMVNVEHLSIDNVSCNALFAVIAERLVKLKEIHIIECMSTTNAVYLVDMLHNMNNEAKQSLQMIQLQYGLITDHCVHFIAQQLVPSSFPSLHTVILDRLVYEMLLDGITRYTSQFAPKYPTPAVTLFIQQNAQKLRKLFRNDENEKIHELWNSMSDEEKKPYTAQANAARQEFAKKKAEFNAVIKKCKWKDSFHYYNPTISTVTIVDLPASFYSKDADNSW